MQTRPAFVNNSPGIRKWHTSLEAVAAYTYVPSESPLPPIGATESDEDPMVYVKLFDPSGSWTWYLTEADRTTGEAFGLVKGFEVELGYIDLNELASARGTRRLPIERDIHFTPRHLSEVRRLLNEGKHV